MTLRRYSEMKPSAGTQWPKEVREHIESHQPSCVGHLAGMPGPCGGSEEIDHIRASGGIGLKSKSIATNGARCCSMHHRIKTEAGKQWRPKLIDIVNQLASGCESCEAESLAEWGVPLNEHTHVDPVYGCKACSEAWA